MNDPLQHFADCFTQFAEAMGNLKPSPQPAVTESVMEPSNIKAVWGLLAMVNTFDRRLQTVENRLSVIHRGTDRQEIRLDAQLGRIIELENRLPQVGR